MNIPRVNRQDEVGSMASAVQVFKVNAERRVKLEADAAQFKVDLDRKLKDLETSFDTAGQEQKLVVDGLAGALAGLARGDLMVRYVQDVAHSYQALKDGFNSAIQPLQDTMRAIAMNTQGVRAAAREITQASDDLSKRTEQIATSLEEAAAAFYEITATVRQSAENAKYARNTVSTAKTDAAKEIKTLISASSQQVESGVKLVGETGKSLERIVDHVVKLNGLIDDIASSAQEQATGLNQVNTAVDQMDQVTQKNAAMVEESTAASHSLSSEAEELARLIGQFNIGTIIENHAAGQRHRMAPPVKAAARAHIAAPAKRIVAFSKKSPGAQAVLASAEQNWDEF